MIIPTSLTLLLQGQFTEDTADIVRTIRRQFQDLPIIVSCWESDRAAIPHDLVQGATLVLHSADPGSPRVDGFKVDNIRRQIVSTRAGLAAVETSHVLKLRSDLGVDLHRVFGALALCTSIAPGPSRIFESRVVVTSLTTLDSRRSGLYFHVCDWFYLGRTNDLRALFDVELPSDGFFDYFRDATPRPEICSRYRSETYMVYQLARRRGVCSDYLHSGHKDPGLAAESDAVLRTNFVVVNPWNLGLRSAKHRKLYLWLHPDRRTERLCGVRAAGLAPPARLAEAAREAASRFATRAAAAIIRLRNGRPDA